MKINKSEKNIKSKQKQVNHKKKIVKKTPPKPKVTENQTIDNGEQSDWAARLPEHILAQLFREATHNEGALPTLLRVRRVCSSWRDAAETRSLWQSMDLTRIKEKHRTEETLKFIIENWFSAGWTDLNLCEYGHSML